MARSAEQICSALCASTRLCRALATFRPQPACAVRAACLGCGRTSVSSTEALACPQAQPRQQKALNGGGGQRSGGLGAQRRDGGGAREGRGSHAFWRGRAAASRACSARRGRVRCALGCNARDATERSSTAPKILGRLGGRLWGVPRHFFAAARCGRGENAGRGGKRPGGGAKRPAGAVRAVPSSNSEAGSGIRPLGCRGGGDCYQGRELLRHRGPARPSPGRRVAAPARGTPMLG